MNPPDLIAIVCPECGAENEVRARSCWLCHADLALKEEPIVAELAKPTLRPQWAPSENTELILVAAVAVLMLLMGVGIYSVSKGGVVIYAIFTVPAMLMTIVRASLKHARGEKITAPDAVMTFFYTGMTVLVSAAAVVGLLALIAIAIIIGLIITCFAMLGQGSFR
jgi:hypothetical protein